MSLYYIRMDDVCVHIIMYVPRIENCCRRWALFIANLNIFRTLLIYIYTLSYGYNICVCACVVFIYAQQYYYVPKQRHGQAHLYPPKACYILKYKHASHHTRAATTTGGPHLRSGCCRPTLVHNTQQTQTQRLTGGCFIVRRMTCKDRW